MTRATCHGEQAMCAESFGNTDASGPSHSMPCLAFSSPRSVRNVFRCACGRGRQRLLLRRVGLHMQKRFISRQGCAEAGCS
jgi:hypothetical protein